MSEANITIPVEREVGSRYTWEEKADAAQRYMLNGNMRLVSEMTGIPYQTLCDWKKSEWWGSMMDEIRLMRKAKTGTKLNDIVSTSLELLQDRLENGDWVLNNKTGEMTRRPVSLRDAAGMTNALMTRQLQMEELAERMEHRKETVQETLNMLAREFTKMNKQIAKQSATTIEYVEIDGNAIHDERQTGLQEGSS